MQGSLFDRRAFLCSAGVGFMAALSPFSAGAVERSDALYATAFQKRSGEYGVAVLSERGQVISTIGLPDRGHDLVQHAASGRTVVFARQPGTFALAFDPAGKAEPVTIASVEGRHFYGHGAFSPDGLLLYATENDYDNAAGMIGVYDTGDGYRRIGEIPTHGVGPHEILPMPDGRTLVVANGGIETHPDFGRAKLNIATMRPSLVFVDRDTGGLIEKHELPNTLHQLSIRHMDLDGEGRVWFGCQYEGAPTDTPPLAGFARRGEALFLAAFPRETLASLRNYVGSVAANPAAGTVAFSSPQGNALVVLDAATGRVVANRSLREVCGIAADAHGFFATTGAGVIDRPSGEAVTIADLAFDNHVLRLG